MHVKNYLYLEDLPLECIESIGNATGSVDNLVDRWRQELNFTVDPKNAKAFMSSFGDWDDDELEAKTPEDLANFVLWEACCSFQEQLDWNKANPGADPRDSTEGTDLICLE